MIPPIVATWPPCARSGPPRTPERRTAGPLLRGPAVRRSQLCSALLELLRVALEVLEATAHEEGLLGHVVVLTLGQRLERPQGLRQRDEGTRLTGECLGHEHVLREEPLDATGPVDRDLVLFTELVDAQDGDDVLQLLVALQDPLH